MAGLALPAHHRKARPIDHRHVCAKRQNGINYASLGSRALILPIIISLLRSQPCVATHGSLALSSSLPFPSLPLLPFLPGLIPIERIEADNHRNPHRLTPVVGGWMEGAVGCGLSVARPINAC